MSEAYLSGAQKTRDTLIESGLLLATVGLLGYVTASALDELGFGELNIGNANGDKISEDILANPVAGIFNVGVVAPVSEEVLFRGIPLALASGLGPKGKLGVGLASSAVFASLHGFYELPDGNTGYKLGFPIVQFVGGMVFWDIAQRKGVGHSILAHSTLNTTIAAIVLTMGK